MSEEKAKTEGSVAASSPQPTSSPEIPYTIFDKRQRRLIVFLVSFAGTFSGFASNIYFPALPSIADDLNVSLELVNLTVTSYLIFQGIAPSLWGPISDVRGRRIAYTCTFLVFFGACIGLANTKNYATLIVLRCLQSTGSASTIAIGSSVIGDITTRADRGGFMGIFQAGLLVPIAIGPVIGGSISGSLGWRAIFWFLTIYSYQKTTKIKWDHGKSLPDLVVKKGIDVLEPLRILSRKFVSPIVIFLAIYYAVWQMSITAMSSLFKSRYGLSEIQIGLAFIANGVGSMVGTMITGKILDLDYRRVKAKFETHSPAVCLEDGGDSDVSLHQEQDFPIEKARLRLVPIFSLLQCSSILLFGWAIQYSDRVHIAVPIFATFITGWTAVSTQSLIMTYLVDIFPDRSAAASASHNLAKCLLAAGGTSFVMHMINAVGVGLTFTVCALVQVVALIGPFLQWKFAGSWRKEADRKSTMIV